MSNDNHQDRDAELDQMLRPLRNEAKINSTMLAGWKKSADIESMKVFRRFPFSDAWKIAAGIVLGFAIGAAAFHDHQRMDTATENFSPDATTHYLSAKADD